MVFSRRHRYDAPVTQSQVMIMRVLWVGLFVSTLLFLVSGYVAVSDRGEIPAPAPVMLPALAFVSLGIAAASVLFPRHLLRQSLRAAKYEIVDLPAQERMFTDTPGRARKFANPEAVRKTLAPKVQTPFILGMALAEAVAINGFVLWFVGFALVHAIGFFVVCWILMIAHFPKPARYRQLLEEVYDADLGAL